MVLRPPSPSRAGCYLPETKHLPGEGSHFQVQPCLLLQLPQPHVQQLWPRRKWEGGGGAEGHVRLHQHPPRPTAPLLSQAETLWSTCCPLTSSSGSTCPPGRRDSRLGAPQSNQHPVFPLPTPAGLTGWHPDVGEDAEGAGAAGEQDAAGAGLQQHGHPCGHPPAPQLGGEGELRLLPQALGGAEGGSLRGG